MGEPDFDQRSREFHVNVTHPRIIIYNTVRGEGKKARELFDARRFMVGFPPEHQRPPEHYSAGHLAPPPLSLSRTTTTTTTRAEGKGGAVRCGAVR